MARKQVQANKHLGVLLSEHLSWKSHILAVVAKSNILLGLLKRTFGKRSKALLVGYNGIIDHIRILSIGLELACNGG